MCRSSEPATQPPPDADGPEARLTPAERSARRTRDMKETR